jgi:hypothetical protein
MTVGTIGATEIPVGSSGFGNIDSRFRCRKFQKIAAKSLKVIQG